jgi:membrane associated rhomboid family serine protease
MYEQIPPSRLYAYPVKRKVAWVTWILLGSTVSVFLVQLVAFHIYHNDVVGDMLAFSPEAFAQHRYWTLLTYAWAHAVDLFGSSFFWLHIVSNMIPLVCFGPFLEEAIGHVRYLALYLLGAVVSALTWYFFNRHAQEGIIGASGAIFALIAGAGTVAPRQMLTVWLPILPPFPMRMGILALVICGTEVVQILFHWMPEVAHSAHLGGAAFGCLFVLVVRLASRGRNYDV